MPDERTGPVGPTSLANGPSSAPRDTRSPMTTHLDGQPSKSGHHLAGPVGSASRTDWLERARAARGGAVRRAPARPNPGAASFTGSGRPPIPHLPSAQGAARRPCRTVGHSERRRPKTSPVTVVGRPARPNPDPAQSCCGVWTDRILTADDLSEALASLAPEENRTRTELPPARQVTWGKSFRNHCSACSERFQSAVDTVVHTLRRTGKGGNRLSSTASWSQLRPVHDYAVYVEFTSGAALPLTDQHPRS